MKQYQDDPNLDFRGIRKQPSRQRRGSFVLIPMLCLVLALAVIGEILKQSTIETRQLKKQHFQLQATWLADAAAQRAVARLNQDLEYTGEVWQLKPEESGLPYPGEVVIKVEKNRQMLSSVEIRTEASYPLDESKRVRIIREWPFVINRQDSGN